jgi:hypothetical protein
MPVAIPGINAGALRRDLLHEVRLVRTSLEAQIERLDRIEYKLSVLPEIQDQRARNLVSYYTGPVAYDLDIHHHSNGSVEFAIDGGKSFSLGPQLAEVFKFLASGERDRSGKDALVGWRSRTEILRSLEEATGRKFRRPYVNNIVYLLKKALTKAGYDRGLIQTHRQKGIRLAYKRGAQGPLGTSASAS